MFNVTHTLTICALLAASLSSVAAMAQTWDGDTDGDYLTGTNWNGDVAPAAGDTVTLDDGGLANQPRLGAGDASTVDQVNVSAGTLSIDGTLSATSSVTLSGSGRFVLGIGGSLSGNVSQTGGVLDIAFGTITGNVTQTGGTLLLAVNSIAFIDGVLNLGGGTLVVDLGSVNFDQPLLAFDLLNARDIVSDFAVLSLPGLANGYAATTSTFEVQDGEVYRLTLTAVPEPASAALVVSGLALLVLRARRSRASGRPQRRQRVDALGALGASMRYAPS